MDKESGVYKNAIYIEGDIHHNVYSALYRLEARILMEFVFVRGGVMELKLHMTWRGTPIRGKARSRGVRQCTLCGLNVQILGGNTL